MSHFSVLVVGRNIDKQLARFDENLDTPQYVSHTKEELIANGRKEIESYKNRIYAEYLKDPEAYKESCKHSNPHFRYVSEEFPEKLNWTDAQIYEDKIKYEEEDDITPEGGVYSTYNPNSKWDWYSVGGRWKDLLKLKSEGFADATKFSEINWDAMRNDTTAYDKAIRFWELIVEKQEAVSDSDKETVKWSFYKPEFYTERYPNKEAYAKTTAEFTTFAVLKEGKWYEKGEMGWFGGSSDSGDDEMKWAQNFWDNFLKDCNGDTEITVVDCHI